MIKALRKDLFDAFAEAVSPARATCGKAATQASDCSLSKKLK